MIDKIVANVARLDQHADVINRKADQSQVDDIQANMEHNVSIINQKADKSELNSLKNTVNNKADKDHKHNSIWSGSLNMYINTNGHFLPGKTTQQLGTSGVRWNYVCLAHNPDVSSDRRLKQGFDSDMSKYVDMLERLRPCTYTIKADGDGVKHAGYIAQEVEEALEAAGLSADDFGGFVYHEEEDNYALRYEEFIPVLHAAVIVLTARIEELEDRLKQ